MKNVSFYSHILWLIAVVSPLNVGLTQSCPNSDLEFGNFTHWNGYVGNYSGASLFGGFYNINSGLNLSPVTLGAPPRISLVTPGLDPKVPIQRVYKGGNAIRIGDPNIAGRQAQRVVYNLLVDNNNKFFRYNYAVVLEQPTHNRRKNPFFWARVLRNNQVICETGRKTSNQGDPFFKTHSGFEYRDWDCVTCDLSNYVGSVVQIEFTVAGCSEGGHTGYAYIDGLCDNDPISLQFQMNKQIYCFGESIYLNGSQTTGATSFHITIEESDANFGRPNPASEVIMSFANQSPGTYELVQLLSLISPNFNFKCNTYYRVKLAASNACNPWKEDVKLIYIKCPIVNIPDYYCLNSCTNPSDTTLAIGTNNPLPNYVYNWIPATGLSATNIANPVHIIGSVTYPFVYFVEVTDEIGCSVKKRVKITCPPGPARIIVKETGDCCGTTRLELMADNYNSISWSTGATNVDYIDVVNSGTYSVTITNECGSYSTSTQVTTNTSTYSRYWTNLNDQNYHTFYSSHNNNNSFNKFFIKHVENPAPPYGEYYATKYRLEIYNRWGELIRTIENSITTCQGFANPSIFWDGTLSNGQKVQEGMYNGKLFLKNCRNDTWWQVMVTIPNPYCSGWNNDCAIRLNANNRGPICNPGKWPKKYLKCTQWEIGGAKKGIFPIFIFW